MKHFNTLHVKPVYTIKGAALYNVFNVFPIRDWNETTTRKIGEIRADNVKAYANYWTSNGARRVKQFDTIAEAVEWFEGVDAEKYAANWYNAK